MALRFTNIHDEYTFVIFSCYLPPEGSKRGRDGSKFFEYLLEQIYMCSNDDAIYLCGDFNSRINNENDSISAIDNILNRIAIDNHGNVNKHGECLLDFLRDTKMCIVNGRITPEYDNFTCVKTTGKSVVDYFIVPHDILSKCVEFKVYTMLQIKVDVQVYAHISMCIFPIFMYQLHAVCFCLPVI